MQNIMRKIIPYFFLIIYFLAIGCDTQEAPFEESIQSLYSLSTQAAPEESGRINPPDGEFGEGEQIQIEASPSEGFIFDRWEGDLTGNKNPESLTFDSDKSVTAHFSPKDYELIIEIVGNGTVTETVIEESENSGDENATSKKIILEAVSSDGWFFERWEGDLSGNSNPDTITVDDEKTVTAFFKEEIAEDEYSISVETDGEGRVEKDPDKTTYPEGEEVTLTAVADPGWTLSSGKGICPEAGIPSRLPLTEIRE